MKCIDYFCTLAAFLNFRNEDNQSAKFAGLFIRVQFQFISKTSGTITFAKTDPDRSLPPPGLYAMTEKPKQEPEILNPRYAGATPEAVVLALTRRKGKFEDFETERESENGRLF